MAQVFKFINDFNYGVTFICDLWKETTWRSSASAMLNLLGINTELGQLIGLAVSFVLMARHLGNDLSWIQVHQGIH
jgi:hypothetical protein